MTTNSSNSTYDDLVRLNDQRAITLIPAMVLFLLFMILGLIGNSLVCYIVGFRFQPNNQNFFIISLAIFDLLTCLVAIPTDIVDMRFSYTFPSALACKILRFVVAFNTIGSTFTLVAIGVDRYRKICKPFALQMTRFHIKVALIIIISGAFFMSWPTFLVNGLRIYDSPIKGQKAQDCSTSDKIKDTVYPLIYVGVLFFCFIILCVVLMMLYCMILISLKRHNREMEQKSDIDRTTRTRGQSGGAAVDLDDIISPGVKGSRKDSNRLNTDMTGSSPTDENRQNTHKVSLPRFRRKKSTESCNSRHLYIQKTLPSGTIDETESKTCGATVDAVNSSTDVPVECPSVNHKELSGFDNSEQTIFNTTFNVDIIAGSQCDNSQSTASSVIPSNLSPCQAKAVVKNENAGPTQRYNQTKSTPSVERSPSKKTLRPIKTKTTLIAFLVTLVFILSFLPYLCLQVAKTLIEGFDYNLKGAAFLFHNIFLRSYYMNSILNPFIYGALNTRFRAEVIILFRKMICSKLH